MNYMGHESKNKLIKLVMSESKPSNNIAHEETNKQSKELLMTEKLK